MAATKKRGLGKGLSALLENPDTDITSSGGSSKTVGSVAEIKISQIETNPFQPRTEFEKEALQELADSIAEHGIIQPITVRKVGNDRYQLISGERRFRASQMAGLKKVPAYIRIANDQAMLEMALVENIQRQDLNAIEVALSYQRLIDECDLTQDQLSQKLSKSRPAITNHLRLLKLPAAIQLGIRDKDISMGHARALVSAGDEDKQIELFKKVLADRLSVRQLEDLIKGKDKEPKKPSVSSDVLPVSERQAEFKEALSDTLSAKVDISKSNNGKGKIVINFDSEVDLNRIIELLGQ
ncbi:MAG: ParB/RepB/Spo0J family partition protein [Crocinitomicaceae bacterium]|nr:ParB/RepB/Spo0J family partition protein [Crocinitomicaceae bacterium]